MEPSESTLWASSGAMWLTGRSTGPPLRAPGRPATHMAEQLRAFADGANVWSPRVGDLPGVTLLGERAAIAGLSRRGPSSCGGAFRTVRTRDGWLGLSLARTSDVEFIPALTGHDTPSEPWETVRQWARVTETREADERIALLGLPGGAVPEPGTSVSDRPPVVSRPGGRRHRLPERPLVVDFTSMWAGPLCAHLLGIAGAEVVKVESRERPDGARGGPPDFFALLHAGHRCLSVDPSDPRHRDALRGLIARADIVLESSRPEALARWGLDADAAVSGGTNWLSITARGRASRRVGFGDDIAVSAGLYVADDGEILPCGDALGDPLTGTTAANAAAHALTADRAQLIDISMHDVCAQVGSGPADVAGGTYSDGVDWWLDTGSGHIEVARPRARRPRGVAPTVGAHDPRLLT